MPARLGELSRALLVARRLGRPRELVAPVLGTLVSQTVLNAAALVVLGAVTIGSTGFFSGHQLTLLAYAVAPLAILAAVVVAPALLRGGGSRAWLRSVADTLAQVRSGLAVFRRPGLATVATAAQFSAWALQWLSCVVLFTAVGLHTGASLAAAAAVLFAVNVTAAVPVTPSNVGVFQAACVAVLTTGFHLAATQALGYGIVLQAVELATALIVGMPALVREGVSWRDVRLRALHSAPVSLSAAPSQVLG